MDNRMWNGLVVLFGLASITLFLWLIYVAVHLIVKFC